MFLRQSS